jgi:formate hydrogenlyase transcriptional activator
MLAVYNTEFRTMFPKTNPRYVLAILESCAEGGKSQQELAQLAMVRQGTVAKVAAVLVKQGLALYGKAGTRSKLLTLTTTGMAVLARLGDVFATTMPERLAGAATGFSQPPELAVPATSSEIFSQIAELMASQGDVRALLHELATRLKSFVEFDFIYVALYDAVTNQPRLQLGESANCLENNILFDGSPVEEEPAGWVWVHQQPLSCDMHEFEFRFPRVAPMMLQAGILSCCVLPLTTIRERLGSLFFGRIKPTAYGDHEIVFLKHVVSQVSVAIENILNFDRERSSQGKLAEERDHLRTLLEVNNAVVSQLDMENLLSAISRSLQRVVRHNYISLLLHDPTTNLMRRDCLVYQGGKGSLRFHRSHQIDDSPACIAFKTREVFIASKTQLEENSETSEIPRLLLAEGMQSVCCVPLITRGKVLGTLNIATADTKTYIPDQVVVLKEIAGQVAIAVDNALAYQEISGLKDTLTREKLYLEEELRTSYNFKEIIGDSLALRRVLEQVEIVAQSDSTALIQGETGTGKELIARAIHDLSGRRDRTFVKVNCAAIPTGLLESELFGHEKGAFTGAIAQKIGRIELAHRGTLFLDEIGDVPLEVQPKLLRVLQEREFERLGSTRTTKVDVRVIAATNCDLRQMISDRKFRSDLYYRINVFPLVIPPLRDRRDDIPLLVRHFVRKYANRMKRDIASIPTETMQALVHWHWPGNVRELENLIERAVILTRGSVLNIPPGELQPIVPPQPADRVPSPLGSLATAQREHIVRALRETRGIVSGPRGAAVLLGLKPTTLYSQLKRLGISAKDSLAFSNSSRSL